MMQKTFIMIKPDAFDQGDEIASIFEANGFKILEKKVVITSKQLMSDHYSVHQERPFFGELVGSMSEKKVYALVMEKENAIADARKLIGVTNPDQAEEGTIRKKYAKSMQENAIHGSDSIESATYEINLWFPETMGTII